MGFGQRPAQFVERSWSLIRKMGHMIDEFVQDSSKAIKIIMGELLDVELTEQPLDKTVTIGRHVAKVDEPVDVKCARYLLASRGMGQGRTHGFVVQVLGVD